jgi:hypothetical protein
MRRNSTGQGCWKTLGEDFWEIMGDIQVSSHAPHKIK